MNDGNLSMKERETLFLKRTEYYLSQGYDRMKAADFVATFAGDLASPALDVGAGKGIFSMALAKIGLSVIGVDTNKYDLEFANYLIKKEKLKDTVQFLSLDAKSLPFKSKSFKTVAMMNVLHHLEIKDGENILKEMSRVLADDGKMIIAEFDEEGFEIVAKAHENEGTVHITSVFTLQRCIDYLKSLGIEEVERKNGFCNISVLFRKK